MTTIHISSILCDPGASNDFNTGDTYVIDGYTPGEWDGTIGNLVKFLSGAAFATIDITAIGNITVSYMYFTNITFIGGTVNATDGTSVDGGGNAGIVFPSVASGGQFFFFGDDK